MAPPLRYAAIGWYPFLLSYHFIDTVPTLRPCCYSLLTPHISHAATFPFTNINLTLPPSIPAPKAPWPPPDLLVHPMDNA